GYGSGIKFGGVDGRLLLRSAETSSSGTTNTGSSDGAGSAHFSASITAPIRLPTSYWYPTSNRSNRTPSIHVTVGFWMILMRMVPVNCPFDDLYAPLMPALTQSIDRPSRSR